VWTKRKHHKIFSRFHRWSGRVPAGFDVDFLGTRYKTEYFTMWPPQPSERYAAPEHPAFDEEYFEWIDLLEAAASAKDRFTMLELGAGFGRWTARAAAAAQHLGLPYHLVAVEAEPTHFQWLLQNLQDNGLKLEDCRPIHAAVTDHDGTVGFEVGDPESSYGQAIGGTTEIQSVSLATLLLPPDLVDLIDMDVQGAELEILAAATAPLAQKVKRVHVETHSAGVHAGVDKLFRGLGWKPHFLFGGNSADTTPWGRIDFQGGTESWLNPRLCGTDELRNTRTVRNSVPWRTVNAARKVLDRVAPPGTLLRRAHNATLSGLGRKYRRDPDEAARRPMTW
jgi:FkbM family methyltransferase